MTARVLLGGAEFVKALREKISGNAREQPGLKELAPRLDLRRVILEIERIKGQRWEEFRDRHGDANRDLVLWFGRKRCGLTLKALARWVGRLDYTSVSFAVKRFEQRRRLHKSLQHLIEQVDKALDL